MRDVHEKLICMRIDNMPLSIDKHMHDFTKNDHLERCLANLLYERELDSEKMSSIQRWKKSS